MSSTITISFSELDTFRQCGFKHELAYKQRWSRPPTATGALARGSLWHRVLEDRYRYIAEWQRGDKAPQDVAPDYLLARAEYVLKLAAAEGTVPDTLDLVHWMSEGYVDRYEDEPHTQKTLAVEHVALIPLRNSAGRPTRFRVKVIIDHVKSVNGRIFVEDHKSGAYLPKGDKDLDFHDQFSLYIMGLQRLGKKVFGGVYNASRTNRPKIKELTLEERHSRILLSRTKPEMLAVERDTLNTARLMYSKLNPAVRSPDPDRCNWRCDFTESCLLGRKTNDDARTIDMLRRTGFVQELKRH